MQKIPKMKTVMTPFPHVVGLRDPIGVARQLMMEHKVRHLPVVEDHQLKGLVTDRDIKLMLGPEFDYPNPRELLVEDVMVDDAYIVDIETPLRQVLDYMASHHIGAALVTRAGRLAGIFSSTDACWEFARWLEAADGSTPYPPDVA